MNATPNVGERPAKFAHDLEGITSFTGAVHGSIAEQELWKPENPFIGSSAKESSIN